MEFTKQIVRLKPISTMKKYVLIGAGLLLLIGALVSVSYHRSADAQTGTNDSARCQPYFVSVPVGANVRSCSNLNCAIISKSPFGTDVCVVGDAEDSGWLEMDLTPNDLSDPVAFISESVVTQGKLDSQPVFTSCQSYIINTDSANLYSCASVNCAISGQLNQYDWVCAQQYTTGAFAGWAYAEQSDTGAIGWLQQTVIRPGLNFDPNAIQATPFDPSSVNLNTTSFDSTPLTIPSLEIEGAIPACQTYHSAVIRANIRQCASTSCRIVEVLALGEQVCIRGGTSDPNWLIVDLTPDNLDDVFYAVNTSGVNPGAAPPVVDGSNCFDWYEVNTSSNAIVFQCASQSCPTMTTLPDGAYVCARDYEGSFIKIDVSEVLQGGWIHSSLVNEIGELSDNSTPNPENIINNSPIEILVNARPVTVEDVTIQNQNVSFESLELSDINLGEDIFSKSVFFSFPANWRPSSVVNLRLAVNYVDIIPYRGDDSQSVAPNSTLRLFINDSLAGSLLLNGSLPPEQVLDFQIPATLFRSGYGHRQQLTLTLSDVEHCELDGTSLLHVNRTESVFSVEYQRLAPNLDLSNYPVQVIGDVLSNQNETVVIVLPDDYDDTELNGIGIVASGLGALTQNQVQFVVRLASDFRLEEFAKVPTFYVGKTGTHALIGELILLDKLSVKMNEDNRLTFNNQLVDPTTGIVEAIELPNGTIGFIVTGETDQALLKAINLLTKPIETRAGQLALVTEEALAIEQIPFDYEFSFAEIGESDIHLTGVGRHEFFVDFYAPPNWQLSDNASIELDLDRLSDLDRQYFSSFGISINGTYPLPLNEAFDSSESLQLHVSLPDEAVRKGEVNTLVLQYFYEPDTCGYLLQEGPSLTIKASSRIVLDGQINPVLIEKPTLGNFFKYFGQTQDLSTTLVSLPMVPSTSDLSATLQTLAYMGSKIHNGTDFKPVIVRGELPANIDLEDYNLVVIGTYTSNPLLITLNQYMPIPYADDASTFSVSDLPQNVGAIQVTTSLWSDNHIILFVVATDDALVDVTATQFAQREDDFSELSMDTLFISEQLWLPFISNGQ